MEQRKGVFYAVGIGPGDPELMTVKAITVLQQCDVIAAPVTGDGRMLAMDIAKHMVSMEGKTLLPLEFTMSADPETRKSAHVSAAEALGAMLDSGRDVAMLNLGDVSIYATAGYMIELLGEWGYETRMIPGVASFSAVAARLGCSLTEMKQPLHIIPAGAGDPGKLLELPGTKVLMKSGRQVRETAEAVLKSGRQGAMVENCGLPGEHVYEELSEVPETAGYFSTFLVKE